MLRCDFCQTTETPLWRAGPRGPKTLCNACGVKWKKGKLDGFGSTSCGASRPHTGRKFVRVNNGRARRVNAGADGGELLQPERGLPGLRAGGRAGCSPLPDSEWMMKAQRGRRCSVPPEARPGLNEGDWEQPARAVREPLAPSVFAPSLPCRRESTPVPIPRKVNGRSLDKTYAGSPGDHLIRESMFVRVDSERALATGPEALAEMMPDWDSMDIESLSDDELEKRSHYESSRSAAGSNDSIFPFMHNRIGQNGDQGQKLPHDYPPSDEVRSLSPAWSGSTTRTVEREQPEVTSKGVRLLLDAARYVEYASSPLSSQWSPLRSASSAVPFGQQAGSSSPSRLTPMRLTPLTLERD
ncbi:hypothetical protein CCYA_CCYA17G4269 [Cyanidiococcus yangmingshanensis]|nr:hypothetical protein CCYA_CCYA17G4269 [Cyanidiococcus yangmingshanensis]